MKRYIFWGVGKNATFIYKIIPSENIAFAVDSNTELHGMKWNGLDICDLKECKIRIKGRESLYDFLITPTQNQDIVEILQSNGLNNYTTIEIFLKQYMMSMYLNGKHAGEFSNEQKLELLMNANHPCYSTDTFAVNHIAEIVCGNSLCVPLKLRIPDNTDLFLVHGIMANVQNLLCLNEAKHRNIPSFFVEDGYLSSIVPFDAPYDVEFRMRHAMVVGVDNIPINAKIPSDLEKILNSDFSLSPVELTRVKKIIDKIRRNYLSKYNHQPICKIKFDNPEKRKVLVIDQLLGDKSIEFGNADENTFLCMLQAALRENPDADVYIKAHPVKNKGHFSSVHDCDNVTFLYENINPICLLENMDKVYVCTSQMGFEAAFCGKEVHVFGMPFYAGWGVTIDYQTCKRRKKIRTLEEVFYAAYILETIYVSYKTNNVCEIEQAMDELLELRALFWSQTKQENQKITIKNAKVKLANNLMLKSSIA